MQYIEEHSQRSPPNGVDFSGTMLRVSAATNLNLFHNIRSNAWLHGTWNPYIFCFDQSTIPGASDCFSRIDSIISNSVRTNIWAWPGEP